MSALYDSTPKSKLSLKVEASRLLCLAYCAFLQTDPRKAENFDEHFRKADVKLSCVNKQVMKAAQGLGFEGFDFVNPFYDGASVYLK